MKAVIISADKYRRALEKHLIETIEKRGADIIAGVPVDVYKERVAEVRAYQNILRDLDEVMKKASQ